MSEIRVTPQDLRSAADVIEASSKNISKDVSSTAQIVESSISFEVFSGQRADALIAHYRQIQNTMESWPNQLIQFATLLRNIANQFEAADKASNGDTSSVISTPPDPTLIQNQQAQVQTLSKDIQDKWQQLKDKIHNMGHDGIVTLLSILAAIGSSGAALVGAGGLALVSASDLTGESLAAVNLFNDIQKERQQYIDLNAKSINANDINATFNTPAGLDQLQKSWTNINNQAMQDRTNIYQQWSKGSDDIATQVIFAVDPIAKPIALASTFDSFFDVWTGNEMRLDQSQANLQAIAMRRASLPN